MAKAIQKISSKTRKQPWQTIALTSGVCAAINAIFAKLTTDSLTTSFSAYIITSLPIPAQYQQYLDVLLRASVFGLSFLFTGIMWALYTKALSISPSAVQVNVVNTASNFIITALLGALVFGEKLPMLWWVGAGFLVVGSVVIGGRDSREEKEKGE